MISEGQYGTWSIYAPVLSAEPQSIEINFDNDIIKKKYFQNESFTQTNYRKYKDELYIQTPKTTAFQGVLGVVLECLTIFIKKGGIIGDQSPWLKELPKLNEKLTNQPLQDQFLKDYVIETHLPRMSIIEYLQPDSLIYIQQLAELFFKGCDMTDMIDEVSEELGSLLPAEKPLSTPIQPLKRVNPVNVNTFKDAAGEYGIPSQQDNKSNNDQSHDRRDLDKGNILSRGRSPFHNIIEKQARKLDLKNDQKGQVVESLYGNIQDSPTTMTNETVNIYNNNKTSPKTPFDDSKLSTSGVPNNKSNDKPKEDVFAKNLSKGKTGFNQVATTDKANETLNNMIEDKSNIKAAAYPKQSGVITTNMQGNKMKFSNTGRVITPKINTGLKDIMWVKQQKDLTKDKINPMLDLEKSNSKQSNQTSTPERSEYETNKTKNTPPKTSPRKSNETTPTYKDIGAKTDIIDRTNPPTQKTNKPPSAFSGTTMRKRV